MGAFREIPNVYICFDSDLAGRTGTERVARLIPHARIVRLPEEVGDGGDVTEFFVRLGRSPEEFARLLEAAQPLPEKQANQTFSQQSRSKTVNEEVERLKQSIAIEDLI